MANALYTENKTKLSCVLSVRFDAEEVMLTNNVFIPKLNGLAITYTV